MLKELRPALLTFVVLTVITGIVYPLLVSGFAQRLDALAHGIEKALIRRPQVRARGGPAVVRLR